MQCIFRQNNAKVLRQNADIGLGLYKKYLQHSISRIKQESKMDVSRITSLTIPNVMTIDNNHQPPSLH